MSTSEILMDAMLVLVVGNNKLKGGTVFSSMTFMPSQMIRSYGDSKYIYPCTERDTEVD
jgi:hypothetical protein